MKGVYKIGIGLGALFLVAMADIPQTVRIKALVIKLLPLNPATTNNAIRSLCDGAYASSPSGPSHCYNANYDQGAADLVARQQRCDDFKRRAEIDGYKDWHRRDSEMWLYIGEEEGLKGYWFLPEKCMVMNLQGGSVRRLHRWNWWLG